jgi:sRNA-binding carbon storage regulator CsrA
MLALTRRKGQRIICHSQVCENVVIEHQGLYAGGVSLWIQASDSLYLTVHLGLHDDIMVPVRCLIDGACVIHFLTIGISRVGGEEQDSRIGIDAPPFIRIDREELRFRKIDRSIADMISLTPEDGSANSPKFDVGCSTLDVRCSNELKTNIEHRTSNTEHRSKDNAEARVA